MTSAPNGGSLTPHEFLRALLVGFWLVERCSPHGVFLANHTKCPSPVALPQDAIHQCLPTRCCSPVTHSTVFFTSCSPCRVSLAIHSISHAIHMNFAQWYSPIKEAEKEERCELLDLELNSCRFQEINEWTKISRDKIIFIITRALEDEQFPHAKIIQ